MKKTLFIIVALLTSMQVFAQYHVQSGQTFIAQSLFSYPFPNGLVIDPGGTLVMMPNSSLHIGAGKEIVVMGGGRLEGNDGTITVLGFGNFWNRMVIRGAGGRSAAVELNGCTIDSSLDGLFIGDPGGVDPYDPTILMTDCTLNSYYKAIEHFGASNDVATGIRFIGCKFNTTETVDWPIKFSRIQDVVFEGCEINVNSGEYEMHFDHPNNVTINNCEMEFSRHAIGMHFSIINCKINNCTINQASGLSSGSELAAIVIGNEAAGATVQTLEMNVNRITVSTLATNGIQIDNSVSSCSGVTIRGNILTGSGGAAGIKIAKANGSSCEITENDVSNWATGISCFGNNSSLNISCNKLSGIIWNGIEVIYGQLADQSPTGGDPSNTFNGVGNKHVFNEPGNPVFKYHTLNPLALITQNVSEVLTNKATTCSTINEKLFVINPKALDDFVPSADISEITLYPNPTSSGFELKGVASYESCKIYIVDMTGKLVRSFTGFTSDVYDVNDLPNGYYSVKVIFDGGLATKALKLSVVGNN